MRILTEGFWEQLARYISVFPLAIIKPRNIENDEGGS